MRVEYKLKEICKWSAGNPVEFRYVDIFIRDHNGGGEHQTLELPVPAAIALVNAMRDVVCEPSAGDTSSEEVSAPVPPPSSGEAMLQRDQIISLISSVSNNSADHDIAFAQRILDAAAANRRVSKELTLIEETRLRIIFEGKANDSWKFVRSIKGTYKNPQIARDWKWFLEGASA
jgi:hypothetical protein